MAIEAPRTINPQEKKIIVAQATVSLCDTWVQSGQDRPSAEEVVDFLGQASAKIRDLMGWS